MKKSLSIILSLIIIITSLSAVDFSALALPADIDIDSAVTKLKEGMIDREDSIAVSFSRSSDESTSLTNSELDELKDTIFNCAISEEYSQSSVDGDYLRWSYSHIQSEAKNSILSIWGYSRENITITYTIDYYTTKEQEQELTEELDKFIEDNELKSKGDYTKIKLIHDYILDKAEYDYDTAEGRDDNSLSYFAYGAVFNNKAVCQGYATLFYRLCKEVGLDCRIITGENHVWNIVKLNGLYYEVDCTWDDTTPSDNYFYFLKGKNDFYGHTRIEDCASPEFEERYPVADIGFGDCPHSEKIWIYPEDADCTVGFEKKQVCALCDEVFETETIAPDSEHNIEEEVFYPTCTEEGYTIVHCTVCSYIEEKKDIKPTLSGTGTHDYDDGEIIKQPSCTESGEIKYCCKNCDEVKSQWLSPTGHTPGEQKIENICYPTCITPGSYDVVVRCTTCNEVLESTNVVKEGYANHNYVQTSLTPPSCIATGEITETCSVCGATRTQAIPMVEHTVVEDMAVPASYTSTGLTSGSHCSVCGVVITPQQTVAKLTVPKITLSSVKSSKKKELTVKWKKNSKVSGYEIQYTTDKKFKKNVKKATIKKSSTTSTTLKKLASKKKYYVRIRAYKTVNGKKYYSSWSSAKAVTTESSTSTNNNVSKTVYITPTGKKYHYDNHCNGGSYKKSTLKEAKSRGLTACKKCVY